MKIQIELSEASLRAINYFRNPSTGKLLSPTEAIQILADDLELTNTRPGSWEAEQMQKVIDGHGWKYNLSEISHEP